MLVAQFDAGFLLLGLTARMYGGLFYVSISEHFTAIHSKTNVINEEEITAFAEPVIAWNAMDRSVCCTWFGINGREGCQRHSISLSANRHSMQNSNLFSAVPMSNPLNLMSSFFH